MCTSGTSKFNWYLYYIFILNADNRSFPDDHITFCVSIFIVASDSKKKQWQSYLTKKTGNRITWIENIKKDGGYYLIAVKAYIEKREETFREIEISFPDQLHYAEKVFIFHVKTGTSSVNYLEPIRGKQNWYYSVIDVDRKGVPKRSTNNNTIIVELKKELFHRRELSSENATEGVEEKNPRYSKSGEGVCILIVTSDAQKEEWKRYFNEETGHKITWIEDIKTDCGYCLIAIKEYTENREETLRAIKDSFSVELDHAETVFIFHVKTGTSCVNYLEKIIEKENWYYSVFEVDSKGNPNRSTNNKIINEFKSKLFQRTEFSSNNVTEGSDEENEIYRKSIQGSDEENEIYRKSIQGSDEENEIYRKSIQGSDEENEIYRKSIQGSDEENEIYRKSIQGGLDQVQLESLTNVNAEDQSDFEKATSHTKRQVHLFIIFAVAVVILLAIIVPVIIAKT